LTRGYQNRIINGAFVINQRSYTSGTNLASGSYGFDRWKSGYTNTSLTFTAGSQSTTVTISTSGVIQQIIEQANMPAGTYTLSWTGTATGRVYNSGATPPAYAASPVAVTLDGTANVVVEFTASGATKTCSLVQLEGGTVYSPFEYRQREEEFALCQRYYQSFQDPPLRGVASTDTRPVRMGMVLPVQMRQAPNAAFTGTISYFDGATVGNITGVFQQWLKASHVEFTFNGTVGLATAGRAVVIFQDPNGFMNLEAEL
jgi:hypothetical protein